MTCIAISGHRGLPPEVELLIDRAIREELAPFVTGEPVGLSCLADGADQIFARAVADLGGSLEIVVPATRYREALPELARPEYDELISRAAVVHRLDHVESTSQSHMDASIAMLERADLLFAVWDGQPARGFGGTADVVTQARAIGIPVTVIWPDGVQRD